MDGSPRPAVTPMKRPHPTIALLLWLTAAYAASYVGTMGALRGMVTLYLGLARPPWAPPAWLFNPAWTLLSALLGTAAWRVWRAGGKGLWLWWVGLFLGALWPWLFFGFGKLGPALAEIAVLWFVLLATILAFSRTDRAAAWCLTPLLAWVGFEAILNLAVWRLN